MHLEEVHAWKNEEEASRKGAELARFLLENAKALSEPPCRVAIDAAWIEAWAACIPLSHKKPLPLLRWMSALRLAQGILLVDPLVPWGWTLSEKGARMESLWGRPPFDRICGAKGAPKIDPETWSSLCSQAVGIVWTNDAMGALSAWFEEEAAPFAEKLPESVPCLVGPCLLERLKSNWPSWKLAHRPWAKSLLERIEAIERPILWKESIGIIPTGGRFREQLTLSFVIEHRARKRIHLLGSQAVIRWVHAPYHGPWPTLRAFARIHAQEIAPCGDAEEPHAHRLALHFERALCDRDPNDPCLFLVHLSSEALPEHASLWSLGIGLAYQKARAMVTRTLGV
ncbi:MAG: hypothetical protein NZM37_02655 [Sandaracinaceae bacterium]|nr:hypothetical protein [Sandaracinaceae bacterium]